MLSSAGALAPSYHILMSFGAWDEIFAFMDPIEVIKSQIVNRWMYSRGVARCQRYWKFKHFYFTMCDDDQNHPSRLIKVELLGQGRLRCDVIVNEKFNFKRSTCAVVNNSIFVFKAGDPVHVIKHKNPLSKMCSVTQE